MTSASSSPSAPLPLLNRFLLLLFLFRWLGFEVDMSVERTDFVDSTSPVGGTGACCDGSD